MSTLVTNNIQNLAGTASTSADNVINGSAKAWVNFNGTGTPAIRASYNVSSITDNGTGDYTVNFTNAFTDANYAITGTAMNSLASANLFFSPATTAPSTTALRLITLSTGYSFQDSLYVSVAVFR